MPYCSRCGVEVDEHVAVCPLCDTAINITGGIPPIKGNYPDDNIVKKDNYIPFELKRKIFWSLSSFFLVAALFIIFAVNFLIERTITWGWIPLFSVLLSWGVIAVVYYLYKRAYILIVSLSAESVIYLYFLFMSLRQIGIFYYIALPVLIAAFVNIISVLFLIRRTVKKGFNVIGFILTGALIISVCIDIIISYYNTARIIMTWSIIAVPLLSLLVIFLFYIHYILKWEFDINKIFHI